ncbi:MAG TPA: hypothetical protein PK826_04945 [Anaerolineae bacterium]|nr:hypothetical protein [Anaerolineae bacterium]
MTGATAAGHWTLAPSGSLALRFEGPAHLLDLLRRRFAAWPPAPGAADAAALRIAVSDLEDGVEPAPARLPQIGLNGPRLTLNGPGLCASADLATGKASAAVAGPQAEALLDYLARVLTALLLDQAGGLLLHGAGLVRAGRGLLLLGPSGTGKTTAARNAAGAIVLNDDLVALLPAADGAWQLLATPFSNPTQVAPVPGQAPLAGVLRLRQAAAPELRPLSRGQALAELAAAVPVLVADGGRMPALMARLNGLVAVSPCAILGLRDRPDYWPVVDAWLTGR